MREETRDVGLDELSPEVLSVLEGLEVVETGEEFGGREVMSQS